MKNKNGYTADPYKVAAELGVEVTTIEEMKKHAMPIIKTEKPKQKRKTKQK